MAHHVEPMDIDSDFDNKENSLHHNNVLPFTEKGYEELDVSELNMKLRYSVTPVSSPMSKSYTANCLEHRNLESGDDYLNVTVSENSNLTRSLNSTITKNDSIVKSLKALPLQAIPTEQYADSNRNTSVFRSLDTTITPDNDDVTVTVNAPSDIDENLSLPSSSSSTLHTPEATTPTKDIPPKDGGSPIMRGIKSVLSMFRTSQSPIPPVDDNSALKPEMLSPLEPQVSMDDVKPETVLASTPIAAHRKKEMSPTKRSSPQKELSIVFNEDLEKELQWKDETTIIFSQERIPIHKLMLQQPIDSKTFKKDVNETSVPDNQDLNSTVEYMDISYNDSKDRTVTDIQLDNKHSDSTFAGESDSEFVDCETTFTKNDSNAIEDMDKTPVANKTQEFDLTKEIEDNNDSGSRLKPIILDTTQDILDATLSVRPEDLLPDILDEIKSKAEISRESNEESQIGHQLLDQTVNVAEGLALEKVEDPNITKALDVLSTTKTIDHTFDVTTCDITDAKVQKEDLDVTKTKDSNLSETLNDQLNDTENLNCPITNETITLDNKTFDAESTPVVDIIVEELNKTEPIDCINNDPIAPVFIPPSLEEITTKLLSCTDSEVVIVKESSLTELPVDVPLPDEDDLDKELNFPTEMTTESTTPSVALTLDLVDDIKTSIETTNLMNAEPMQEKQMLTEDFNKYKEKTDIDVVNTNTISKSGDISKNLIFELNPSEFVKELNETVVATNNTVIEAISEPVGMLPENTSINAVLAENIGSRISTNIENTELTQTNIDLNILTKNEDANIIENVDKQKDIEVPMDINESIGEFKPLPDVINQIIYFPDNVESTTKVHEAIAEVVGKTEDCIKSEVGPEAVDINEPQMAVLPSVESNEVVEELTANKSLTLETDINVIENQLNEDTKVSISENEIPINKESDSTNEMNENVLSVVEKVNIDKEIKEEVTEIINTKPVEEEIIVSENSSPFVSVIADDIPEMKPEENTYIETVTDAVDTITKVVFTPPSSPPIRSKGYNFNFDDLDFDPFSTKTNIRMSPPLDSPNKPMESNVLAESRSVEKRFPNKDNNRRKSQPERKRPAAPKRKFNSSFDGKISDKVVETPNRKPESNQAEVLELHPPNTMALSPSNVSIEEKAQGDTIEIQPETPVGHKEKLDPESEIIMEGTIDQSTDILAGASESSINIKLKEVTSSSEQSTYYSAGTSSSDTSIQSRNVFNLPEIDDMNFNPFATKSKMRQSPPPDLDIDNPFITKSKVKCSPDSSMITQENKDKTPLLEDKIENELMEKEVNLSNTTTSSKATDEKLTTTSDSDQIRTEDEDTVEGPFLEAEDLNTDDKMLDFDSENIDMMQFNELPTQSNEENVDNGELFIDAEAFEFLLNQNKSNTVVDSGKESLFLKFDPLFAKRMSAVTSDGVVASLAMLQRKQSTPTKTARAPPKNMPSPIPGPSNLNVTQDIDMNNSEELNEDLNITVSKPMMVVPPAVNPVTPRNKSLTPNRSNRHSITFTSPAMAVIDRLLSLSSNNSMVHDTTVTHVSREPNEADIALSQLRELLAEKEISVYQLRTESRELRDRLSTLESNVKSLENVCEDRLKKINQLNDTLAEKTKINRSMAAVVEEYERTIASLIAETAQDKKRHAEERIKLINERDEQTAHLTSMEVSFSDLHSKYEKSKQVILNCKANEEAYKKSIKDFEENFTKMQNNYELLKQHATSKLNHANQEMEKMNRTHEAEVLKLNAMIKRKELHITSLEESLNQKTKANEELTAICDELINKVG